MENGVSVKLWAKYITRKLHMKCFVNEPQLIRK